MKLDVVVPCHCKDLGTIRWCIRGIKNHLDAARVLVVCNRACRQDVENAGGIFLDEDQVVAGLKADAYSLARWGWYFQQILKLGMADRVETDYYLVVDADTVFLRDIALFDESGKPFYATGTEHHQPYFDVFERLLGFRADWEYSFTVHHMVYNRAIVREMRAKFPEQPWHLSVVRYVEPQAPWFSASQLNEQDTYGHYLKKYYKDSFRIRQLAWRNVPGKPAAWKLKLLALKYDYCSFHAYNQDVGNRELLRRLFRKMCRPCGGGCHATKG